AAGSRRAAEAVWGGGLARGRRAVARGGGARAGPAGVRQALPAAERTPAGAGPRAGLPAGRLRGAHAVRDSVRGPACARGGRLRGARARQLRDALVPVVRAAARRAPGERVVRAAEPGVAAAVTAPRAAPAPP